MRRLALTAVLLAAAGGCGGNARTPPPPKPPRLPHALAQTWARQANEISAALAAGDGCAARARAAALQHDVIVAVNARRVPRRLLEPLSGGVNDLVARIVCIPPTPAPIATPSPPPQQKPRGKPPEHGHGPGHGHGKHGGDGGD